MTNLSKIVTRFKLIAKEKNPAFKEDSRNIHEEKKFRIFVNNSQSLPLDPCRRSFFVTEIFPFINRVH